VIKPDGTRGLEAVANQANQVEVTVNNSGGIDAVNAYVDVFFGNSATGFAPVTAAFIGGNYLTIPSYGKQAITFSWMPPPSYTGHGCLLARVRLIIPADTYVDPNIFDVRGDRHVTQRNIEVIAAPAFNLIPPFPFNIVNPTQAVVDVQINIQEINDPKELSYLRASLGCGFAQFGETPLPFIGLSLADRDNRPVPEIALTLGPGEIRPAMIHLQRNLNTRTGDLHAVQITQTDKAGQLQGGLTVIIQH
jgi:hypothetical protein